MAPCRVHHHRRLPPNIIGVAVHVHTLAACPYILLVRKLIQKCPKIELEPLASGLYFGAITITCSSESLYYFSLYLVLEGIESIRSNLWKAQGFSYGVCVMRSACYGLCFNDLTQPTVKIRRLPEGVIRPCIGDSSSWSSQTSVARPRASFAGSHTSFFSSPR
jgi:hypothetical protein